MSNRAQSALELAGQLEREAEALERKRDFPAAARKYDAAVQLLRENPAAKTWTLLGQKRRLDAAAGKLALRGTQARNQVSSDGP
jgi:hypothetical protein